MCCSRPMPSAHNNNVPRDIFQPISDFISEPNNFDRTQSFLVYLNKLLEHFREQGNSQTNILLQLASIIYMYH